MAQAKPGHQSGHGPPWPGLGAVAQCLSRPLACQHAAQVLKADAIARRMPHALPRMVAHAHPFLTAPAAFSPWP